VQACDGCGKIQLFYPFVVFIVESTEARIISVAGGIDARKRAAGFQQGLFRSRPNI
jgi:hypothetical protein